MSEHESVSNYGSGSTAVMPGGYCPLCSSNHSFVYHQGHCPQVKAKEYFPNGRVKRIEFNEPLQERVAGLHQGTIKTTVDFDEPLKIDSTRWAREAIIEEPTLLEPGKYTIRLGELCKVVDDSPPGFTPLPVDAGILKAIDITLDDV